MSAARTPGPYIDIICDGPPSHQSGRFVEVENSAGQSISVGQWVERTDGYWALRIPSHDALLQQRDELAEALKLVEKFLSETLGYDNKDFLVRSARAALACIDTAKEA